MHIMNFTIKPRCEVPALQIFGSSYVLSSGVKISLLIYAHWNFSALTIKITKVAVSMRNKHISVTADVYFHSVMFTVITAVKSATPTLTHVIPSQGGDGVTAVTSLGDDVFVARHKHRSEEHTSELQ